MSVKRFGWLRPLVGIVVLLAVLVSMMVVPGLRSIGIDFNERALERVNYGDQQAIQPPVLPFPLPDYLTDVVLTEGTAVDLAQFVSREAHRLGDVLQNSAIVVKVGEAGGLYEFNIGWDTGREGTVLEVVLRDDHDRPRGRWEAESGQTDTFSLPGGCYRIVLTADGILGENFWLVTRAGKRIGDAPLESPVIPEIPTLYLDMSEAASRVWEDMRDEVYQQVILNPSVPVRDQPDVQVPATLSIEDVSESTVEVWLAGLGDPRHFDEMTPSMTGRVIGGPVLFGGIYQFKLYGIDTQGGLTEYIAADMIRNEGVFVPRWLLVRLVFQGQDRGLYIMAETPNSIGFFAGVSRDDGQVWGQGALHADLISRELAPEEYMIPAPENSPELTEMADAVSFAKAMSFISRFSLPHGFSDGDLRFYRPPFLDVYEPILRDINTSGVNSPPRTLLVDTSWWLGIPLKAQGSSFNPKIYPLTKEYEFTQEAYRRGPTDLAPMNIHPALDNFINSKPENREIFERFLLYSADEAFTRRFIRYLQEATEVAHSLPDKSELLLEQLNQIDIYTAGTISVGFRVPNELPALFQQSALLSFDVPEDDVDGLHQVTLYNLSPFSARLHLPDWVILDQDAVDNNAKGNLYLSPSPLFPAVIPILGGIAEDGSPDYPLPREAAERLLSLERLRLGAHPDVPCPLVAIKVPEERWQEFREFIATGEAVALASWYSLAPEQVLEVDTLPDIETPPDNAMIFWDFDENPIPPENLRSGSPLTSPGYRGNGAGFDGQSTFVPTDIDISTWPALTLSLWVKPEPVEEVSTIFDLGNQERAWVSVDLGEETAVSLVRLLPREGFAAQLWDGTTATLQASDDGSSWKYLAVLSIDRDSLSDDWVYFALPDAGAYRYYRLAIGDNSFYSISRLEVYTRDDAGLPETTMVPVQVQGVQAFDLSSYKTIPLSDSQIEVSSTNHPSQGKENLVKPGTGGFWHVNTAGPASIGEFSLRYGPASDDGNFGTATIQIMGAQIPFSLPYGDWSHLALATKPDSHQVRFYLNGIFQNVYQLSADTFGQGRLLTLGGDGSATQLFSGVIDDFRMSPSLITDDDATWLMGTGAAPLSPQIVALPLGISPTYQGHRLTLLISNFSQQEITLDLEKYIWRLLPGDASVPCEINGVWGIMGEPQPIDSNLVTLGPARYGTGWFETGRSSPLLWTGSLWGLLVGPDDVLTNTIVVEVELTGTAFYSHIRTDGDDFANSAVSSDGAPVRVAVHESAAMRLPLNTEEEFLIYPESLSASDKNTPAQDAASLVDGEPATFWHVANPPETSEHWVTMAFGRAVHPRELIIMPREGFSNQLWDGDGAVFQGSEDGVIWQDITNLPLDRASLETDVLVVSFHIPDNSAYRYYRLYIDDPEFRSLAELRLLGRWEGDDFVIQPENTTQSDINNSLQKADSMFDGNPKSFWHIAIPPQTTQHWAAVDFGQAMQFTGLAVLPRWGLPGQMWNGKNAVLEGSQNGGNWEEIIDLPVYKEFVTSYEWLYFPIPVDTAYRHYRISIDDIEFFSIAEMRFYAEKDISTTDIRKLEGSGIIEVTPDASGGLGEVRFTEKEAVISDVIEIPESYRLVITPGTTLRFGEDAGILSYGPVLASGTEVEPVQLLPLDEDAGWKGVAIIGAAESSRFEWVEIKGARAGPMGPHRISGGLAVMSSRVTIRDTILEELMSPDTLHLHRTVFDIERLTLRGGIGDGIDSDWCFGTVSDSVFRDTIGDAIDLSGSLVTIRDTLITGAQDKAISIGEGSVARIVATRLLSNRIGIAAKDMSLVYIEGGEVRLNEYGVLRYIKKPAYGYPLLGITGTVIQDNSVDRRDEEPNRWTRRYDG